MSNDFDPAVDPGTVPPLPPRVEGDVAVTYVQNELVRTSRLLAQTRIICTVLVILALIETIYVTSSMQKYLQPKTAADIADGVISQRVDEQQGALRDAIAQQVPQLVAQIPDQAIHQMPTFRENLEGRFTTTLNSYAQSTSKQLDAQMGDILASHKDEVHAALTSGGDTAAVHKLGAELSAAFIQSLKTTQDGSETLQGKIDGSLSTLQDVKTKMDRLANAKDLTPQERKTRHLIAIMGKTISVHVPQGNATQAISGAQKVVSSHI